MSSCLLFVWNNPLSPLCAAHVIIGGEAICLDYSLTENWLFPQKPSAVSTSSIKGGGLRIYWELPYTGDNVLPRSHRMPKKKPSARWRIPPWSCWLKCRGDTPEQCRLLPLSLGYSPELDIMALLLKIPCPLITRCGNIKLVLFRKLLPAGWLSSTILPTNKLCELQWAASTAE